MQLPQAKSSPERDFGKYTFLIYGQPKAGKTTFAANFEEALFIATEPGHKFQEIYKVDPLNWEDIKDVCRQLCVQKERQFKTIIFDTIDNAWQMAEENVCKGLHISHVSDADFGKAYQRTKEEFMRVVRELTLRGYGVVFISHAQTKDEVIVKGVERETISKTDTTLGNTARKAISGLCDMIFYCWIASDGNRYLRTKGNENTNAGDRSGKLPEVMPLDFDQMKAALMKPTNKPITKPTKPKEN